VRNVVKTCYRSLLNRLWLVSFAWIAIAQPVYADYADSRVIERPTTTVKEWLTQIAQTSTAQITNIQLQPTETGLELILVSSEQLQPSSSAIVGNALILDIPKAALVLPNKDEFQIANPVEGITLLTVVPRAEGVRITVTGLNTPPKVDPRLEAERLVLSVSTTAVEATEVTEDEIIVTAERTPENVQDVPISITVLTEDAIEDANINFFLRR
jgi:iron complex outermembrane recepter protein